MKPTRPPRRFHPEPFAYHEEIELEITALSNLGQGIGRIDGRVIFVPFTAPGDRVRARVWSNRPAYSEADLVQVLSPAPERVEPRCPLFTTCGGCQYQHLAYPAQLAWKRRQVGELLAHMAGIETEVEPVIPSPRPWAYRSKITPHFQKPRDGEIGPIGFLRHGRRSSLVDVPSCPIAADSINEALPAVREEVQRKAESYRKGATLLLRASRGEPPVVTDPRAPCEERVGELRFRFPAGEFFQNNPHILEAFSGHVRDEAAASGAAWLLDAYCGSGFFALTASRAFREVHGIEISEQSIHHARANAEANGIGNARFHHGSAEAIFPAFPHPGAETAVVIDPPRRGSNPAFLEQLFAFGPRRVVYVSCNPATQIRDLASFQEAGYRLRKVQPFDLFPQTRHLECVMTLDGPAARS